MSDRRIIYAYADEPDHSWLHICAAFASGFAIGCIVITVLA